LTQSNSCPVGSPPRASSGSPSKRALPRFVLSKSMDPVSLSILQIFTKTWNVHAKRYKRQTIGSMRRSSFRTSCFSSGESPNNTRVLVNPDPFESTKSSVEVDSSVGKWNEFESEADESTFPLLVMLMAPDKSESGNVTWLQ
jgi:hypothetical protein